jgi:nicotinamidase-related amidase
MPRIWDRLLSERDRAVYAAAGYGRRAGGGLRPALFVVDVTHDFVGDRPEPIMESIKRFSNSCGEAGWEAMARIAELLAVCREAGVPIFYTRGLDDRSPLTHGSWGWKKDRDFEADPLRAQIGNRIPDVIAPLETETVIQKTKPSAFFGTPLASYLTRLGVDTIVVTGVSTSGCVRATVLDGFSLNYRVLVAEDGVFDRGELSHLANLFDMNEKYADVLPVAAIADYVRSLPSP